MKLYVNFENPGTLKEFLEKFFSHKNNNEPYLRGVATYLDKECNYQQCGDGKLRSFDDVFDLVNTYFEDITPKELIHTLLLLDLERGDKKLYLHTGTCSSIQRIRMLYVPVNTISNPSRNNSYMYTKYDSKYSWGELFDMVNVNTTEDIINYKSKIYEEV